MVNQKLEDKRKKMIAGIESPNDISPSNNAAINLLLEGGFGYF
jgi:hypothetical protein